MKYLSNPLVLGILAIVVLFLTMISLQDGGTEWGYRFYKYFANTFGKHYAMSFKDYAILFLGLSLVINFSAIFIGLSWITNAKKSSKIQGFIGIVLGLTALSQTYISVLFILFGLLVVLGRTIERLF